MTITIQDQKNFYFVGSDSPGFEAVKALVLKGGKRDVSHIESLFYPVRTNNLASFSKDFFLPGVCQTFESKIYVGLSKTVEIIIKIVLAIPFFVCDVVTFPIRLVTAIPRYFYNRYTYENELAQYVIVQEMEASRSEFVMAEVVISTRNSNGFYLEMTLCKVNLIERPCHRGFEAGRIKEDCVSNTSGNPIPLKSSLCQGTPPFTIEPDLDET
jgi:hypothetical protein